jgi:hypothetical protein
MVDGVRIIMQLCVQLSALFGLTGWRQHEHLLSKIKYTARNIQRISSRKGPHYQRRLKRQYRVLLRRTNTILRRARALCVELEQQPLTEGTLLKIQRLKTFIDRTERVRDTAHRRVIKGEKVPNEDKLFSMFEVHTQHSRYASLFSRRYRRWGSLFQGRFKAILVENQTHAWELSRQTGTPIFRENGYERDWGNRSILGVWGRRGNDEPKPTWWESGRWRATSYLIWLRVCAAWRRRNRR